MVLAIDEHSGEDGKYLIRTLYFDDFTDVCQRDNEAGIAERFKWRIRYYDGGKSRYMHLERKDKKYGRTHKESCELSDKECLALIQGDTMSIIWQTEEPLLRRFCTEIMLKHFTPRVIIDYERVAFVEPITNIRVTLDMNISAGYEFEKFLDGDYLVFPVQEKKRHVLEVKFDDILPGFVRNVISASGMAQTSFSKYSQGRRKLKEVI